MTDTPARVTGTSSAAPAATQRAASAGQAVSPLVEITGLRKSFGAVHALQGVDLKLAPGEVTALLGDNGAGKSTLVRCLTGVHPQDAGEIRFRGEQVRFHSPDDARQLGIETVYQTLGLIEDLPVWQNLYLNHELTSGLGPFRVLDKKSMIAQSSDILSRLDVNVPNVRATVRRMSGGQRQCIAIARAANWGRTLVIMDEPTAALGVRETAAVEELIARLREASVTVLLISHDMAQVLRVADTAYVLRRGRTAARRTVSATTGDELVGLITGAVQGDADA
ncbi:ATP-binding cassette domain-containing protein [Streptomyces scabiei]|uniref:ATP-binding cassette domain-containing protein n=1 Tax=Streptomyces scabiei TaxID=1930 RepID=UPI0029905AD9|nr:ATP-binding cassette domain-containing protein [Streptomyces scabiei]MDW8803892.1 ATP-binding cassette domain-containing protein [Streptomyces scabiei]